jgi:hypothetical protein
MWDKSENIFQVAKTENLVISKSSQRLTGWVGLLVLCQAKIGAVVIVVHSDVHCTIAAED